MLLLAVRFLAEILGLLGLGYWGATASVGTPWRVVLGIAAPLALAIVWALVVAPKADNPLSLRTRELIGTALLVLVAGMLALAGQPGWGIAFAAVVIADQALVLVLDVPGTVGTIGSTAMKGNR